MEQSNARPATRLARSASLAAGVLGLVGLALVIGGEVVVGTDFMSTTVAGVAAWVAFASACLLVVGLTGLVAQADRLGLSGLRGTSWAMQLVATVVAGAAATLPLVVIGIVDRAPELVNDPPVAVPATFILSGLVLGGLGLRLAVLARRAGASTRLTALLAVASVVTMVPLPSRQFLVGFAVAALLSALDRRGTRQDAGQEASADRSASPANSAQRIVEVAP